MRGRLISWGLVVLLSYLAPSLAAAAGTECWKCHTMHNSQGGLAVTGANIPMLLMYNTCLGVTACHTGTNSATIKYYVLTTAAVPTATQLAGGNFYWTEQGATATFDAKAHNVTSLTVNNNDETLADTPPGGTALTGNITCAGATGCHGKRDVASLNQFEDMGRAHHSNKSGQISVAGATTPGASYRFLKGVAGYEDPDREYAGSVTTALHNEYYGEARVNDSASSTATISYLCAKCHPNFHNDSGGQPLANGASNFASPWLRHPTDFRVPNSGEYTAYYTAGYNVTVPVARTTVPAASSASVTGAGTTDAIIMCLTCHRAHGSAYDDILRWDYKAWPGTPGTDGCYTCHSVKN